MSFIAQYKQFIEAEIPVSRTLIRPRNLYSIQSYTDVDGQTYNYTGSKAAFVFAIGIADKKLWCLKITKIRPLMFWTWLKFLIRKDVMVDDSVKRLEDILIKDTRNGKKIFENYTKTKQIYGVEPSAFRSYNIKGINTIKELKIDLNFLKTQYKLKSEEIDSEYKDPKVEAKKTPKVKNEEQKQKDSKSSTQNNDSKEATKIVDTKSDSKH